jgi:pyruvate kinase
MRIKILCTLGPASLNPHVISQLDDRGVSLYRINLSHTPRENLEEAIRMVQRHASAPLCIDTQGAQVRCGVMEPRVLLNEGMTVRLTAEGIVGNSTALCLWPASVFSVLQPGNRLSVDFDGAVLEITETDQDSAVAVVLVGGAVGSNKAVTIDPHPPLPPLTDYDVEAIEVGLEAGIRHFALSFASSAQDVEFLRTLTSSHCSLISKIESRLGVRNMDGIIGLSDAVLIDRGDLSRDIPLEYVPFYQKVIVRQANRWNKPAFVATNLLESMVNGNQATVAEANDLANTLLDGVHGLVLAAETAIGRDPVGTVDMVLRAIRAFERTHWSQLFEEDRLPVNGGVLAKAPQAAS